MCEIIRTHRSTQVLRIRLAVLELTGEMAIAMITTTTLDAIGMVVTAVLRPVPRDTSKRITARRSVANDDVVVPSVCACVLLCN